MRQLTIVVLVGLAWMTGAPDLRAGEPTFDCENAEGAVEEAICGDEYLSTLDRRLDEVFEAALAAAGEGSMKLLRAEQRGWIQGRNDCWKAQGEHAPIYFTESWETRDLPGCVETSYLFRISELQATYRLAPARGPFEYACEGDPEGEIQATYFKTDPPTVRLVRDDRSVTVWLVTTGSGSKYEGQNVTFWAKRDEATVTWGDEKLTCRVRRE